MRLPIGVSPQAIASSLSPEGVLSVDVPLPKPAAGVPVEIIIPVQVRKKNPFKFSRMGSLPSFKKYSLGVRGGVLVLFCLKHLSTRLRCFFRLYSPVFNLLRAII
ncbi:UNVERIFIED_CONTAM: hypothetical protein FKN15_010457 [Acipenser sinensis]